MRSRVPRAVANPIDLTDPLRPAELTQQFGGPVRRSPAVPGRNPDASGALRTPTMWIGVILGAGASFASPILGLVVFGGAVWWPISRARSRRARDDRDLIDALAETIDLYAVALLSGHNIATATHAVSQWTSEPLRSALIGCDRQARRGRILAEGLESIGDELGDTARPLFAALVANERHGAPIVDTLQILALEVRHDRRRRAEAAARKLPVALLFPLVVCVLPAFILLTIVPVIAQAVGSVLF